jgi:FkbM family methyltransferase
MVQEQRPRKRTSAYAALNRTSSVVKIFLVLFTVCLAANFIFHSPNANVSNKHSSPGTTFFVKRERARQLAKIPKKWRPVDCEHLLYRSRIIGTTIDPNDGEMLARWTTTNPPFFVSIHNFKYDLTRRDIYEKGEYYETQLSATFSTILKDAPANSRVVDVGGNIGWYSLLSAAHGHHVDVFEPNQANVIRLCESKLLNNYPTVLGNDLVSPSHRLVKRGTIDIQQYGVGANETTMPFYIVQDPGKATFIQPIIPEWLFPTTKGSTIIPLDKMWREMKWFHRPTPIVILKVDVEGYEPKVFAGAERLLRSGMVENIIMEISYMEDDEQQADNTFMLQLILDCGYRIHRVGYGVGNKEIPIYDEHFVTKFLKLYLFKSRMQEHIWWKRSNDTTTIAT